ncbi:MAG: hypothetical protein FWG87_01360 [Defluviitaleaceae bacterium]|nr:hypothetical protein [Defluviitaleaceae bacterium]
MRLLWGICKVFVGDGFIRPEVRTFYNSGQVTSIKQAVRCCLSGFLRQHRTPTNAERANLGADKSAPYKNRYRVFSHEPIRQIRENPSNPCPITSNYMDKICIPLPSIYTEKIRENPPNPRKSAFHALKK